MLVWDQNQVHKLNNWSCWPRCLMLKAFWNMCHTWPVMMSCVRSRTEVFDAISWFEGLSCLRQGTYLYLTSVEFKLLVHTEKGSLKSTVVFFLLPGLRGLCFCLENFTCPVSGHRARCEAVGQLFSKELTNQRGSVRWQHEPWCRREGQLCIFRTAPVPAPIYPFLHKD